MVTLKAIKAALNGYRPSSSLQADTKATLVTVITQDPQHSNEEFINTLRDDLPPEVLYSTELLKGPTTLFHFLRDYLTVKCLDNSPHPRSNSISYGLVDMSFTDIPDRIIADANLSESHTASTSPSVNQSNQSGPQIPHPGNDSRIAHNIASDSREKSAIPVELGNLSMR